MTELAAVGDVCGHNCCQVNAGKAVPVERSINTLAEIAAEIREREAASATTSGASS